MCTAMEGKKKVIEIPWIILTKKTIIFNFKRNDYDQCGKTKNSALF